jgi:hypothetical protein
MVNAPNRSRAQTRTLRELVIQLAIAIALATPAFPQGSGAGPSEAELAKASQNPVADLVSLPLQYNYYTAGGLGQNSQMVLNVQPVLPLSMGKRWLLVSRTIVPFVSIPITNDFRTGGTADIQEQAYFTAAKPGKVTWALGPVFSFPTATNRIARTGQWGLGPTAVVLVMPGPWVIGALVNNVWRIGGDAQGHVLNTFTTQPFINFNLPFAWSITTAPIITADWSAGEGQKWTVPIGIGVGKITHIGTQAMNFGMQYYHNLNHPSVAGAEQMRFQATLLWPTAAAAAAAKAKGGRKADDQE